MEDLIKKITNAEKLMNEKSSEKDKTQGALDVLMSDLKKKYDINTIDELSDLIDKKEKELDKLEKDLKKTVDELEQYLSKNAPEIVL